jgi:hypothetical protein
MGEIPGSTGGSPGSCAKICVLLNNKKDIKSDFVIAFMSLIF